MNTLDPAKVAAALPFKEPHALFVAGEDHLRVASLSSGGGSLIVSGRFLSIEGDVRTFRHVHGQNSSRTTQATSLCPLGVGWLLNVTVGVSGAGEQYGSVWARVDLVRGQSAAADAIATLIQGSVTGAQRRAWPGSPIVHLTNEPGIIRSVSGTDPAAGAEISETVPTGARWRIVGIAASLVADGTAANRFVTFVFDDGTTTFAEAGSAVAQTAGQTRRHVAGAYAASGNVGNNVYMTPIQGGIVLLAGHRIRTVTENLQAGDNWGAPQLIVEEWLEGA